MDLLIVRNFADRIQAHYLALAGTEKAKALLYQDARERTRSAVNHTGRLADDPSDFRDVRLGRGQFSVFRAARIGEGTGIVYGVLDEESRLNINTASAEELRKLYAITADLVSAIMDWRDSDNAVSQGGAEADYYASRQPPSRPRNAPFETVRELLMVRGMSSKSLFADDLHATGLVEGNGLGDDPAKRLEGQVAVTDTGWAGLVTANSGVDNVNAAGQPRVNVQSADQSTLEGVRGITPEIARAIVAYRGQNRLESITDLLDVTAAPPEAGPATPRIPRGSWSPDSRIHPVEAVRRADPR